jgi:hypothetical protein
MVAKIISGAQTGADQAGLTAAVYLGLPRGGWVPRNRMTENGPLTDIQMQEWDLKEHQSTGYKPRTLSNVLDADGTVIFGDISSPGSRLTISYCKDYDKPCLLNPTPDILRGWVKVQGIEILNVAGNRESTNLGIYQRVFDIIVEAFR